uniref:Polyketide synthase n=1 Tax=Peronospora matthiolae TaxID=2874970 RepID=A0AAV1U597_9STRA
MTRVDGGGCGGGQVSMASPVDVCLRDFFEKCACVCEARLTQLVERKTLNLVVMGGFEPHDGRLPMMRSKRMQSRSL